MKKARLFVSGLALLTSCTTTEPPKKIATDFIQAVYAGDATTAAALVTEQTKPSVATLPAAKPSVPADESFSLVTLTETVNGSNAEVKNETITLLLQKEDGRWKVAASPTVVSAIAERGANLAAVQQQWETLFKEYKSRLLVAKDFVQYKKGRGALSAPMQSLEAAVNKLLAETDAAGPPVGAYAASQKALEALLDKAYEPSQTASADISMNYFLELNGASDRIKNAKQAYNEAVAKAPSATYPVVP